MKYKCALPLLLFLFISNLPVAFAQKVVFVPQLSSTEVPLHTVFTVTYSLNDAGELVKAPDFRDFKVVGGPMTQSFMSNINGKSKQNTYWQYNLLATKQGEFKIPSAIARTSRGNVTSSPATVKIVKAVEKKNIDGDSRESIQLNAETKGKNFYPGQQIFLGYNLLLNQQVESVNGISEDDYAGFFVNYHNLTRRHTDEVLIKGRPFTRQLIKALALFPYKEGTFTIDPMIIEARVPLPGGSTFPRIFSMFETRSVQIASNPLEISVKPYPPNAPSGFSGAVGEFEVELIPGPESISMDEAIVLQAIIRGTGDMRRWSVPALKVEGEAELFTPKILSEDSENADTNLFFVRTIEYKVLPQNTGKLTIHLPLVILNPETGKYETISSDTLDVQVTKGSGSRKTQSDESISASEEDFLMNQGSVLIADKFWKSPIIWLLFGLILMSSAIGYSQRKLKMLPAQSPADKLDASPEGTIRQIQIISAENDPQRGTEKLVALLESFISSHFQIPMHALNEDTLRIELKRRNVNSETEEEALSLYRAGLFQVYARQSDPASFQKLTLQYEKVVNALRQY